MKFKIETFSSVLIANRGEIACRIIRSAKKCGIKTIAVYTKADQSSPHVQLADQAVLIGDGYVIESYLSIPKLISAALSLKVDAIHPGYGFLSENADFALACEKNNIIFIGPKPESIRTMGNKAEAKKIVSAAGVPCIPGSNLSVTTTKEISSIANNLGYPLMIKAAAGGGGKGMRLVKHESELHPALKLAESEALSSFGSDEIILERAIMSARHVEIQIFGDSHGNLIHLGERDCSIQRRHQKIVEEAPSPAMDEKLRHSMGEIAIKAAKEINYVGAGTIEFLLDERKNFYFLEMNTRLQVEHPVTEIVANIDLVSLQFLVADGKALPFQQNQVKLNNHAIEIRLYAEDPANGFLPSSGPLNVWSIPEFNNIRVDNGVTSGDIVTPFYDPLLAKIIGHGNTRSDALNNLIHALENTSIFGVKNNRNFLIDVLKQKKFRTGLATTSFLEENYPDGFKDQLPSPADYSLVAALIYKQKLYKYLQGAPNVQREVIGWSNSGNVKSTFLIKHAEELQKLHVTYSEQNTFLVGLDDDHIEVLLKTNEIRVNGCLINLVSFNSNLNMHQIIMSETDFCFEEIDPLSEEVTTQNSGAIRVPMHGMIEEIFVNVGDKVKAGDCLLILEAMKMQHQVIAPIDGSITEILTTRGNQVSVGDFVIQIHSSN